MTHDLMKRLVRRLGARLDRVVVSGIRDHTYLALLHLVGADGEPLAVDARPSDAIALALRLRRPILVAAEVFAAVEAPRDGPIVRVWGLTVQDLTPALAELLAMPGVRGVLVSDVDAGGPGRAVLRGDVIVGVDGEPVTSLAELAGRARGQDAEATARLSLRRRGREVEVRVQTDGGSSAR